MPLPNVFTAPRAEDIVIPGARDSELANLIFSIKRDAASLGSIETRPGTARFDIPRLRRIARKALAQARR